MQFYDDKRFWYVPMTAPPGSPNLIPGMPMDTEGQNTGALVKVDILLSERDILRVGGEYQRYRLNDWWLSSGGRMWPNTFWNINNGERDRLDIFGEWETRWNPQWISQFGVRNATVKMNTGIPVPGMGRSVYAGATAKF
ncbi:MAG: hypothetical protein Q7J38_15760 [Gallionella sp.]|nr:hypothetical protein [Gallionella sp.]